MQQRREWKQQQLRTSRLGQHSINSYLVQSRPVVGLSSIAMYSNRDGSGRRQNHRATRHPRHPRRGRGGSSWSKTSGLTRSRSAVQSGDGHDGRRAQVDHPTNSQQSSGMKRSASAKQIGKSRAKRRLHWGDDTQHDGIMPLRVRASTNATAEGNRQLPITRFLSLTAVR